MDARLILTNYDFKLIKHLTPFVFLSQTRMTGLLKPIPGQKYVDLVVSFDGDDGEDVPGPPVRYFF